MFRPSPVHVGLCSTLLCAVGSRADAPVYGARAKVERPLAARNEEDATAAATSVDLTTRPMPLENVRDVLREVPGALAVDTGGYGSFSSVSLRGADLGQTVWLLGDVPLNTPDTGAFDISLLPLGHLERIEVYRGGAPVWLGQGSIGGVVRVVPRTAPGTGASAQLGTASYGRYELRALGYARRDHAKHPVSWLASVTATHAQNNYRYLDDQATLTRSDDTPRTMRDAQLSDGSGLTHLRIGALGGAVDVVAYGISRVGGSPGAAGYDTNAVHARAQLQRALLVTSYATDGRTPWRRRYRAQLLASAQNERRAVYDPYRELPGTYVSTGQQNTRRFGGRAAATLGIAKVLEGTLVGSVANDTFESDYAGNLAAGHPSTRNTAAIAPELRLYGRAFGLRGELRASLRSEWSHTASAFENVTRLDRRSGSAQNNVGRVAFALEPVVGLTLRGSLGSGRRLPAFSELFGDGVRLAPSPLLKPERGRYADLGGVLSQTYGPVCLVVEANGFVSQVDDKIVWIANLTSNTAKAFNQGSADLRGLELGAEVSVLRNLRLVGASTLMDTRTDTGKQLTGQPKLRAYARAEGSLFFGRVVRRLTSFASIDHMSTAFFDRANTILRIPRTLVGVGVAAAFFDERFELAARVNDIFDIRGQDYLGFPLPGRAFALVASFREDAL